MSPLEKKNSKSDNESGKENGPLTIQVGGDHYKEYTIQPIEYAMANGLDFCQANAIKYITRHKEKGGLEDLRKAKHLIDMLIHFEYEDINVDS